MLETFHECKVREIIDLNPTLARLFVINNVCQQYQPGQYVHVLADGLKCPLSIACQPRSDNLLEFHLNHPSDNTLANRLYRAANTLKYWLISGPFGTCTVDKLNFQTPIIFIGYGTGFAPIKSILESLLPNSINTIQFYWAQKSKNDFYLLDLLQEWQIKYPLFNYVSIFFDEYPDKKEATHSLLKMIVSDASNIRQSQVYASGPRPFLSLCFNDLTHKGLPPQHFYSDLLSPG